MLYNLTVAVTYLALLIGVVGVIFSIWWLVKYRELWMA